MESAATESRRPRLLRLSPEMLRDMAELKNAQSSDRARLAFLSTCAARRGHGLTEVNIRDLPLGGKLRLVCPSAANSNSIRASDSWCRCRKRNYAMSIERLFDAVERSGDIGRRVAALVLPISNRPRVTSSCAGKIGLREPGEHTSGPNLASRDNVAHNHNLYTILETPPPIIPLCRKQARTYAIRWSHAGWCA